MSLENDRRRFMDYVSHEPNSGCWLWDGAISDSGYATFRVGGKTVRPHRWYYLNFIGPAPRDLDHLCRTRCCVNPDHLEPVSRSINMLRSPLLGLAAKRKTHCHKGHTFTLRPQWGNQRYCFVCRAEACRKRRERLKLRAMSKALAEELKAP